MVDSSTSTLTMPHAISNRAAPEDDPSPGNWKDWLAHRENAFVEGIDVFERHAVIRERTEGLRRLRVTELATNRSHSVTFPNRLMECS